MHQKSMAYLNYIYTTMLNTLNNETIIKLLINQQHDNYNNNNDNGFIKHNLNNASFALNSSKNASKPSLQMNDSFLATYNFAFNDQVKSSVTVAKNASSSTHTPTRSSATTTNTTTTTTITSYSTIARQDRINLTTSLIATKIAEPLLRLLNKTTSFFIDETYYDINKYSLTSANSMLSTSGTTSSTPSMVSTSKIDNNVYKNSDTILFKLNKQNMKNDVKTTIKTLSSSFSTTNTTSTISNTFTSNATSTTTTTSTKVSSNNTALLEKQDIFFTLNTTDIAANKTSTSSQKNSYIATNVRSNTSATTTTTTATAIFALYNSKTTSATATTSTTTTSNATAMNKQYIEYSQPILPKAVNGKQIG